MTNQGHSKGFEDALEDALKKMKSSKWNKGPYTVEVKFELGDVQIRSPGHVGFYKVTVTG